MLNILSMGDSMNILFIYNPSSGQTLSDNKTKFLKYIEESPHECEFFEIRKNYGSLEFLNETTSVFDIIVAIGGDGTISRTVDAILKNELDSKLIVVPGGSANEYAKSLGVDFSRVEDSLKLIDYGTETLVDVGKINDTHFTYVAAFGNFTSVSYETPQKMKNFLGQSAYWLYGIFKLNVLRNYQYKVEFNGDVYDENFLFGFISNADQFGNVFKYENSLVEFDDGLFEVMFVRRPKNVKDFINLLYLMLNQDYDHDIFLKGKTDHINLDSYKKAYNWNLDGEDGGKHHSAEVKVLKKRLKVLV